MKDSLCQSREPVPHRNVCLSHQYLCLFLVTTLTSHSLLAQPITETNTIVVELQLETGGSVSGAVLEMAEDGLVIVFNNRPFALAWDEVEVGSAYRAKRDWLYFTRGGANQLLAQDHFDLGSFALARGRLGTASREFGLAKSLEPTFITRIRQAFTQHRQSTQSITQRRSQLLPASEPKVSSASKSLTLADKITDVLTKTSGKHDFSAMNISPVVREKVMAAYRQFGRTVEQTMGRHVGLVETEHFLIWTDWEKSSRPYIASLAERMYETLCKQFGLDSRKNIFLAKCPMFCWISVAKLREFAQRFDGYDGINTAGYTRSVQQTGHVHIVLVRMGTGELHERRFAETLVHEGTHAFLHRLYSTKPLPQWVNEGIAELMTQRVVGAHCINDIKAHLLSRQYVKHKLSIAKFLASTSPIDIGEYPLAHSVIAFLERQDAERFAKFIQSLKKGQTLASALAANFDGMTLATLETQWRSFVRNVNRLNEPASKVNLIAKPTSK